MNTQQLLSEFILKGIRSSGPGGQHANKTSSGVELQFDIRSSSGLTSEEKDLLLRTLKSRLTKSGMLLLQCDTSRSQHRNRQIVIARCFSLLETNLETPKERKATKPTRKSKLERLESKKRTKLKKDLRKPPEHD
jgi:ribosome-associated protein